MTTDQLINNVMRWGVVHHLDDPKAQLNKVIEEVGELAHEICRNRYDSPELRDSVGDVLFSTIVLSQVLGVNPTKCLEDSYEIVSKRIGKVENGCFVKNE